MTHFLFTAAGKTYLQKEYAIKGRSTYDIAESLKTYPKLVSRALHKHRIAIRDRSEAQSVAIQSGRHQRRKEE